MADAGVMQLDARLIELSSSLAISGSGEGEGKLL